MRAIVLFILITTIPGIASAWWNDAWSYRVPVAVDTGATGANISTTASNVPVLLRLHSANFEDFFLVKEDLSDLRFIAQDGKTPLKFHVESFDLLNQLAYIWVQLPQLNGSSSEKIWMYYGNDTAQGAQDPAGTFSVNQVAAIHFDAAADVPGDATAYGNQVSAFEGMVSPASLIAGGVSFVGNGPMVLADSPSLRLVPEKGFTLSMWIKPAGVQNNAVLMQRSDGDNVLELAIDQSALYAKASMNGATVETPRTAPLTLDSWQHVAMTLNSDTLSVYLNGLEVASVSLAVVEMGGALYVGAAADNSRAYSGEMDELGIHNVQVAPVALQVAAKNQGTTNLLTSVGKGEQLGNAGGTSYFVTIFQNTGTEGWVVIILLTLMAVLSWIVIAFKAMFLGRVGKDNRAFMQQYQKLKNRDIAALDREDDDTEASESEALFGEHDHFQSSPLYHIYHRGIAEVRDRVGDVSTANSTLNDSSVNSIRSGLEAYVTREIQALNRNMVLLTIAVSGGPFLGLLGTVLGVMITFAAIAASGDVNIAAIAPGVAAALLTTVAGLVVAIPALFGYNWLATRIKAMVADMHVFTDELVTKIAEQYSHK